MRSVPGALKPKPYSAVVASHGTSGLLVATERTTPSAEPALLKGRDQVARLNLVVCPEMREARRRQKEEGSCPQYSTPGCYRVI